jgi:hypothetical protein
MLRRSLFHSSGRLHQSMNIRPLVIDRLLIVSRLENWRGSHHAHREDGGLRSESLSHLFLDCEESRYGKSLIRERMLIPQRETQKNELRKLHREIHTHNLASLPAGGESCVVHFVLLYDILRWIPSLAQKHDETGDSEARLLIRKTAYPILRANNQISKLSHVTRWSLHTSNSHQMSSSNDNIHESIRGLASRRSET